MPHPSDAGSSTWPARASTTPAGSSFTAHHEDWIPGTVVDDRGVGQEPSGSTDPCPRKIHVLVDMSREHIVELAELVRLELDGEGRDEVVPRIEESRSGKEIDVDLDRFILQIEYREIAAIAFARVCGVGKPRNLYLHDRRPVVRFFHRRDELPVRGAISRDCVRPACSGHAPCKALDAQSSQAISRKEILQDICPPHARAAHEVECEWRSHTLLAHKRDAEPGIQGASRAHLDLAPPVGTVRASIVRHRRNPERPRGARRRQNQNRVAGVVIDD